MSKNFSQKDERDNNLVIRDETLHSKQNDVCSLHKKNMKNMTSLHF